MSSDSEDDEQLKHFLEAADPTLLNNAMFQGKCGEKTNAVEITGETVVKKDLPKSQRYILDDDDTKGTDFNLPETIQKHMAKKLSDILKHTYEFCDIPPPCETVTGKKKSKFKSRLKLLKGDETYVNSYEDFEYETKGPEKKPAIKRRLVDASMENNLHNKERLRSVAVDGDFILSKTEVKFWAEKKERKNKVFYYKTGSNGVLHAKEDINEFTAARRKNKWSENKIRHFKIK